VDDYIAAIRKAVPGTPL